MTQVQHPHKILVVDDEPDVEPLVLQRMRRNIRAGQYAFVFAGNGVEALERLRQEPDIAMVLSDINMPQMDGLTLLEQIPDVDPNVRCVIVSAYGDMENIRTAMNRARSTSSPSRSTSTICASPSTVRCAASPSGARRWRRGTSW